MPELDDGALELRLRGILVDQLGSLRLDITVEELERRRQVRDRVRRRRRGWFALGLAAALTLPVGVQLTGQRPSLLTVVDPSTRPSPTLPSATPDPAVSGGPRDLLVSTDQRRKLDDEPCVNLERYDTITSKHRRIFSCIARSAVTADGSKAALGGEHGLPIIDLLDGRQVDFVETGKPAYPIQWSPSGRWLQWKECGPGKNDPCTLVQGSTGDDRRNLLPGGEGDGYLCCSLWLPGESKVLVPADGIGGWLVGNGDGSDLRLLDPADTATSSFLAAYDDMPARLSPDGIRIGYPWGPYVGGNTPVVDLWVATLFDGSDARNLTNFGPGDSVTDVAWSPDGRTIAFTKKPNGARLELWLVENGDALRRVEAIGELQGMPGTRSRVRLVWSPDGSRLAVERGNDEGTSINTSIVAFDGSPAIVLKDARRAAWSRDGLAIAVVGTTGPSSRLENDPIPPATIEVANADGSGRRTIAVPTGDLDAFRVLWAAP
jgi:WD40 repeat protein